MTTVIHCREAAGLSADQYVYIGRPSKWGNPFNITKRRTRNDAINEYKSWIVTQPELMAAIPELVDKVLGCWCKPQACHGDVLAHLANDHARRARVTVAQPLI